MRKTNLRILIGIYLSSALLAGGLFLTGCGSDDDEPRRDEVEEQRIVDTRDLRGNFDLMVDAALMHDMTVGDHHFLPSRARLSRAGEQRVIRLAAILDEAGGEIRFNTYLDDDQLIAARVDSVLAQLSDCGIDVTQDVLTIGLPASVGIEAREAAQIRAREQAQRFGDEGGGGGIFGAPGASVAGN